MDFFKKYQNMAVEFWQNATASQRLSFGALGVTVLIALVLLASWGSTEDLEPVFYSGHSSVDVAHRSKIEAKLTELGVQYEYRNGILHVPSGEKERVVAAFYAAPGTLPDTEDVWGWIWEPDWTGTEQRTRRKVNISLGRKLQRMIGSFNNVRKAEVQVAPADENRTFREENPARAAVLLHLDGDIQLSKHQVLAISQMLTGAVQDLAPTDVQISDANGRYYEVPDREEYGAHASDQLEMKQQWDEYYTDLVRGALGPLGQRAYVEASVTLDMTKSQRTTRTVPKGLVKETERSREEERTMKVEGPEQPGVVTNVERELTTGPESTEETISELETTFDHDEMVLTEDLPRGKVLTRRVVVYLPYSEAIKSVSGEAPEDEPTRQANAQATKQRYQTALATIAELGAGDVQVEVISFPEPKAFPEPGVWDQARFTMEEDGGKYFLGLLTVAALFLVTRSLKRAIPPPVEEDDLDLDEEIDENLAALMRASVPGRFEPRIQIIRDKIQDIIEENPSGASAMLNQWVKKD